jgi:hypothetical protein
MARLLWYITAMAYHETVMNMYTKLLFDCRDNTGSIGEMIYVRMVLNLLS